MLSRSVSVERTHLLGHCRRVLAANNNVSSRGARHWKLRQRFSDDFLGKQLALLARVFRPPNASKRPSMDLLCNRERKRSIKRQGDRVKICTSTIQWIIFDFFFIYYLCFKKKITGNEIQSVKMGKFFARLLYTVL